MKQYIAFLLAFVIACLESPFFTGISIVHAFQEQHLAVVAPDKSHTGSLKSETTRDKSLSLSGVDDGLEATQKDSGGFYIPGLGTLPDLDFGLELLYGDEQGESTAITDEDQMGIKGRIKHKF